MESPPSSERVATVGCDNNRQLVCDGIEVDGEW